MGAIPLGYTQCRCVTLERNTAITGSVNFIGLSPDENLNDSIVTALIVDLFPNKKWMPLKQFWFHCMRAWTLPRDI